MTARGWLGAGAAVTALLLLAYGLWGAYLFVFASEGPVPPSSRLPEVPAGVEVVGEGEQCASGGCWRELELRPADGDSPAELAAQLDLTVEERQGWRLLDPGRVAVSAAVAGDVLRVSARYDGLD